MTSLPVTNRETDRVTTREQYREAAQDTKEDNQRASQDLIASQPLLDDLPSNQEMLTEETDLQEEFDSMGLLTQYLGPSGPSNRRRCRTDPEGIVERQKENFKRKYLDLTDILNRAVSHLEALANAKSKGRTPTRLRITTKPVVVHSKDEDFRFKWAQACRRAELMLIEVLLNHLEKVITETRSALRDTSGQTYKELKQANATDAKRNMEEALQTADMERKLRTETWKKRKMEAGPSRPAKKPKDS